MGANEWREEEEWPVPGTQYIRYYLYSDGSANSFYGDGKLSRRLPGDEPTDSYIYNPENPVPTLGGNHSICWSDAFDMIEPGPFDQRPLERRDDILVYTGPSRQQDIEITGPVKMKLFASSSAKDTDFTAKLIDVYPDGRAINITEGIIRARFHKSIRKDPELLVPGQIYEFTIELQPTSNVFKKDHRIRVDVTSSNFPLWDRNPNTGNSQGIDSEIQSARQTIYHNEIYSSHILLPVIT